ncbi:MAG: glycerol-3-phosphate 1-O-acyltransferase PlsY [Clostridiales bacterium]|nr:glycerol-3-phosphate 1-O-acyltransferase PlsY [Clostridiales bacterium]
MEILIVILVILTGYLLGNISPSIIVGRMMGVEIREKGSGNAGSTNALRVLGKKAGAITLVIDVLKGTLAVYLGEVISAGFFPDPRLFGLLAGLSVVIGHIWPIAFKFKGGKGVATTFGVLLGINFYLALSCLLVLIFLVAVTRRVSVGSMGAFITLSFAITIFSGGIYEDRPLLTLGFAVLIGIIVLIKHKDNIKRLIKKEEPRLGLGKKEK